MSNKENLEKKKFEEEAARAIKALNLTAAEILKRLKGLGGGWK